MRRGIALTLVLLVTTAVYGQEAHHHDGGDRLGDVHFATSCARATTKDFDRAVALLHSFEFGKAIAGFQTVLKVDPACTIAYWGIGLSQWGNPFAAGLKDKTQMEGGRATIQKGVEREPNDVREAAYLTAVSKLYENLDSAPQQSRLFAYRDAMAKVAADNPSDTEAQIFYALSLAESETPEDKSYSQRTKAGQILEGLFRTQPNHPGLAHYIIHTYDVPALANKAVAAARKYASIAPDSPHAQHMPSHTFTRLGYWQESIDSNIQSAAVARREGQTNEELHATDYQVYAYLQTAQDQAAKKVLDSLIELEKRFDPKLTIAGAAPPLAGYFALAAIPARYALERGDWKEAVSLQVKESPFPFTEAMTLFAKGMGAARLKDSSAAADGEKALGALRQKLEASHEMYWVMQVEIQRREVNAWAMLASGKKNKALAEMRAAAEMEDKTEKSAVTPGPLAPARELLGEMLMELGRPSEAMREFEASLTKEPNRFRSLYGAAKAAKVAEKGAESKRYYRLLLKDCGKAEQPLRPELAEAKKAVRKS
jgi:tetratricopeptide (TPR) repeat protein